MSSRRPTQERSKFTFRAIIDATEMLLNRSADGKLSARGIADRAGVSVGSLYQYFKGTDSILRALLEARIADDQAAIFAAYDAGAHLPAETRFRNLFRKMFDIHFESSGSRGTLFKRAPSLAMVEFAKEKIEGVASELFARVKKTEKLRPEMNEEIAIYLVSRAVFAVTMSAALEPEKIAGRADEFATELARMVAGYLLDTADGVSKAR